MACAISIVITLVGIICMSTLPIEQYPDIAPPTVRVSTSYTGADANTIMKSVVQPLRGGSAEKSPFSIRFAPVPWEPVV